MSQPFDPYHRWLGIRDASRPPNHYRLLGIEAFEDGQQVIAAAADRQITHIKTFLNGPHAFLADQVLHELHAARRCLQIAHLKAQYDQSLRESLLATPAVPVQQAAVYSPPEIAYPQTQPPAPQATSPLPAAPATSMTGPVLMPAPMSMAPVPTLAPAPMTPPPGPYAQSSLPPPGPYAQSMPPPGPYAQSSLPPPGPYAQTPMARANYSPVDPASRAGTGADAARLAAPTSANYSMLAQPVAGAVPAGPQVETESFGDSFRRRAIRSPLVMVLVGCWCLVLLVVVVIRFTFFGEQEVLPVEPRAIQREIVIQKKEPHERGKGKANKTPDGPPPLEKIRTIKGHGAGVWSLALSKDSLRMISGGADRTVRIWNTETGDEVVETTANDLIHAVALAPDSRLAAYCGVDRVVRWWDVDSDETPGEVGEHNAEALCLAFSPDGTRLASGDQEGKILIHVMTQTGPLASEPAVQPEGHGGAVLGLAFTRDSKHLVSAGADGWLRIWTVEQGKLVKSLDADGVPAATVAVSHDDARIVAGYQNGTIRVWDRASGLTEKTLAGHTDRVRGVAISPDGKWIVSAGQDQTVRLWDVASGLEIARERHTAAVFCVAFSGDGSWLASSSADATIRLWRVPK